ncbi:hypothetical protein K469DRAFT_722441 [Zopfia rhizophila CBS 207.26]|uniref:Uncharacterized protein n=1 Tax=Zopfia rhizophila CBS 207.26 TaxID=1314779 RepID=A0A6A6EV28_9PEZI|nr:hypothetical protein K469DRAFT_722441 [Zopfia rhizophila CBS 207.26]
MDKPKRNKPAKVLHLSMPRTGSVSMMAAYNILGLTTYHGFDFIVRPDDQVEWENAIDAKFYGKGRLFEREDFDALLGEFLSDFPMVWVMLNLLDPYVMRARPATLIVKMEYGMSNCSDRESFEINARETYRNHYEMVRRKVPKERLLEYKLGSAWDPLCGSGV